MSKMLLRTRLSSAVVVIGALLIAILCLSGCGDSTESISDGPDTTLVSSTSEAPLETTTTEPSFDPGAGPVLLSCDNPTDTHSYSLLQVDPETGVSTEVAVFSTDAGMRTTVNFNFTGSETLCGFYAERVFDPSLTRMAVNWSVDTDDSRHVGWVDENGELRDVTAELSAGGSDFAARPQHNNALFDEQGNFVFVDITAGTLVRLDSETLEQVGQPEVVANEYGNIPYTFVIQPDGSASDTPGLIAMPSGIEINPADDVCDLVDDSHLLVASYLPWPDNRIKVLKIVGPENPDSDSIPAITPVSDYSIINAAVSGDGTTIAFYTRRGEESDLFIMPATGGVEPTKLLGLVHNYQILLFWK